jgi:signal transduction histidine kinase
MELTCPWESAQYLIFSSNIPTLLYYSHFVAILAAIIFSLVLFGQRKGSISVKLFLFSIISFIAWTAIDVLLWASNQADLVMFYWSLQILLELLIYASAFYFAYVFINKKDLAFLSKVVMVAMMVPIIALLPTEHILPGIDTSYCNAIESSFLFFYVYIYEIIFSLAILFLAGLEFFRSPERRREIIFFTLGILIYLIAFSSGNIIGSLTEDWALAQIGLFGMPVFIAFLAYSVVKFNSFNIKLISSQALVATIWVLTLAILFVRNIENVRYIVIFTLILFTVLGHQLIKSVKREIEAREALAKANIRLRQLDTQKTEFISFATHQLRSPLTAIRGTASLILEGDMGQVSSTLKEAIQTIATSIKTQLNIVEDYLNVSRIELGTMKYNLVEMDFKDMLNEVVGEQKPNIEAKGLTYTLHVDESQSYKVKADPDKFKQVVMNTIDNSIKYTPQGSLSFELTKDPAKKVIRLKISDTGVGIRADVLPKLFQKFMRAPKASEANIHGTGLGLFIAKEIMNAHGGRIWAESAGEGQGSQFYVELPEGR